MRTLEAAPVSNLDHIFEDNPPWAKRLGKIKDIVGCPPTVLATRFRSLRGAVVGALWRGKQQIDISLPEHTRRTALRSERPDVDGRVVKIIPKRMRGEVPCDFLGYITTSGHNGQGFTRIGVKSMPADAPGSVPGARRIDSGRNCVSEHECQQCSGHGADARPFLHSLGP